MSGLVLPLRCVIDTNVATTANGANAGAPPACVVASARALQSVMLAGHLFLDDSGRIVAEFVQSIGEHWRRRPLRPNALARRDEHEEGARP
jgi:hypothetical protein